MKILIAFIILILFFQLLAVVFMLLNQSFKNRKEFWIWMIPLAMPIWCVLKSCYEASKEILLAYRKIPK